MTKPRFDDPQIADAQQPITELLTAYPEHRRRFFLDAQLIRVQSEAAQHDVVELAVVPSTEQRIDQVLKRLSRGTTALLELAERVSDERAAIGGRQSNRLAFIDDLIRLEQELRVDAVSLALMQTELFDRGSRDRLAAATQTESMARQASTLLPADPTARREVRRIELEEMIRPRGNRFEHAGSRDDQPGPRQDSGHAGAARRCDRPTEASGRSDRSLLRTFAADGTPIISDGSGTIGIFGGQ